MWVADRPMNRAITSVRVSNQPSAANISMSRMTASRSLSIRTPSQSKITSSGIRAQAARTPGYGVVPVDAHSVPSARFAAVAATRRAGVVRCSLPNAATLSLWTNPPGWWAGVSVRIGRARRRSS
jgi:hypothetical protein